MRFVTRSLVGLALFVVTLGLLGMAVQSVRGALAEREAAAGQRRPATERVFSVNVARLGPETVRPTLVAYGDLRSAVQLELRAAAEGTLLELAPGFRDGGRVQAGETIFRIDPAEFEAELALAESDLEDARAEEEEARIGLRLAREELAASERQQALRQQALDRAQSLQGRGVGTAADIETAQLALAASDQILTGLRREVAEGEARINRAEIARRRAAIARDEAARMLANTRAVAPFDGLLADVDAVLGRRVSVNEKLGLLLDPAALEVAFRVSNAEFARISKPSGDLLPLDVEASLRLGGEEVSVPGHLDRTGAASGSGQSGRLVYARLSPEVPGPLRPGDFLTVRVSEPPLADVALVPAAALDPAGRILLVGEDDRLEVAAVRILRRQGNDVVIGGAPFGRLYVTARQPQLSSGVRVKPVMGEAAAARAGRDAGALVPLSPEMRTRLLAAVERDAGLAPELKAQFLSVLAAEQVPQVILERIEAGARGG
ncbi:HlyD family efflux transporter periplasmic adaptor subunit [Rhodobacteraceae bacterium DSL-40]|uniref:efflux RND transporter periplasmic adaptor subunit n=1 Tax=Amaricoccus sp. B4 TaxID=3368557 RepID=UPI000DAD0671